MEKTFSLTSDKVQFRIGLIIFLGAVLRILFSLYGGSFYFGQEDFKVQGDTYGWIDSILNLIHHGEYTSDPNEPNARFFRPPGYAFVIGIFYLITGQNLDSALSLLSWFQVALDCIGIWLVYRICLNIQLNEKCAETAAFFYAAYPFVIVWSPVLYAESISVFFLLTTTWLITSNPSNKRMVLAGIFLGLAVLTRLQCFFILPGALLYLLRRNWKTNSLRFLIVFSSAFLLTYGTWPLLNVLMHQRMVFSQDLRVGKHWSPDYLAFMDFIFAIKTDHQPQYQQIIENQQVVWPESVKLDEHDSLLMAETIGLCRTCGTGFSYFKLHAGLIGEPISKTANCDSLIVTNFKELKASQIRKNPLHHYLYTPLSNLKKALFKFNLYGDKGIFVKLAASGLFLGRTLMIFLGLIALWMNRKKKWFDPCFSTFVFAYFILWYLFLCFIYRNIEIRYLLHCDILLLIPAAFMISAAFHHRRSNFPKD
jgi:4-amino-4-deoxy-L-arabinose transferase-like glycosyltransferase